MDSKEVIIIYEWLQENQEQVLNASDKYFLELYKKFSWAESDLLEACFRRGDACLLKRLFARRSFEYLSLNPTDILKFEIMQSEEEFFSKGYAACVDLLVLNGGNINKQGRGWNTALHIAAGAGYWKVCHHLLKLGADPLLKNIEGWQAFHKACSVKKSQEFLAELLKIPGVLINEPNYDGNTGLHVAASFGYVDTIRFLIESGASVNRPNYRGETPLDLAYLHGASDETAHFLISNKAHSFISDTTYFQRLSLIYTTSSPSLKVDLSKEELIFLLFKSINEKKPEKALFFIQKGADPNTQSKFGETALHIAVEQNLEKVIEALINLGARVDIENNIKITALHLLVKSNNLDLVKTHLPESYPNDSFDSNHPNLLYTAATSGSLEVMLHLLSRGAKIRTFEIGDFGIDQKINEYFSHQIKFNTKQAINKLKEEIKKRSLTEKIKQYGKKAYIAKKGDPVELNMTLNYNHSIIGLVALGMNQQWPSYQKQLLMPLLQISSKDLPNFEELFGNNTELVTFYAPQEPLKADEDDDFYMEAHLYNQFPKPHQIPENVHKEKKAFYINWKEVIEYPSPNIWKQVFSQELLDEIEVVYRLAAELKKNHLLSFIDVERLLLTKDMKTVYQGTKVGGYPYFIQEQTFDQSDSKEVRKKFMFQVDNKDFKQLYYYGGMCYIYFDKQDEKFYYNLQFY